MYYADHLAVAKEEITSRNFCCLVDAAVELYEEEKSKYHATAKPLSAKEEEEEESRKRIFQIFPRKKRTLMRRFVSTRNAQQNPNNGASSSSSSPSLFKFDLNTIPADSETEDTRNRPLPEPSLSSSSLFLGDFKTVAVSEKTKMRNPRNPLHEPSSSSSSSLFLGDSKIVGESEKTKMRNPRNRKRRAVQESNRGKSKKQKTETFSWIGKETPEWLTQLMKDTSETLKWGEKTDLRLIFERTLYQTDVNPKECRLSMPPNELIIKDFLTPVESRVMEEDINNRTKTGVGAILFDQRNVKWGVMLKRWEMKKGRGSWNYALTCGWIDMVKANGLKEGDRISIWCFRWGGLLCFALVTPPSMTQGSSSLALCL